MAQTLSRVELTDRSGAALGLKPPELLLDDATGLTVGLPALSAGPYHVRWTVVSIDSHRTTGTIGFTVAP